MVDDSVKFTINIGTSSAADNQKMIDEAVKKQLDKLLKQTGPTPTATPQATAPQQSKSRTSSASPIAPPDKEPEGGIFGRVDPGVKGFQKRKAIRGSVERFRDDRSKAPHSHERYIFEQMKLQRQVHTNAINSGAIKKVIENHMGALVKGSAVLANPQGFVGDTMLEMLGKPGPHGAAIVAAITAIITAPEVIAQIIKMLSTKGLPFNDDWRRGIEDEVNGLFSIEEKKKRLLGIDSFIVTQTDVFQPETGSTTYNSLDNRDEVIISKIGLAGKAVGVI